MKKSFKILILLLVMVFGLTGCVKYNATMKINKDKSMDYTIIYAVNSSLMGNQDLIDEDGKKTLENSGFKLEEYNQDNMKGYTLSKKIANIDDVSSDKSVEYDLSGIMSGKSSDKIFTVKKGIFKSTYTAKFKFDSSESDLNDVNNLNEEADSSLNDTTSTDTSNDINLGDDLTTYNENDSLSSLENYTKNMDLSFNVELPYKAKSSNATKKENDGKKLSWNLTNSSDSTYIEFSFEMYNMTFIYIIVGLGGALVVILIIGMIVTIKNNKNKKNAVPETVDNNVANGTTAHAETPSFINPTTEPEPVVTANEEPSVAENTVNEVSNTDINGGLFDAPVDNNVEAETNNTETANEDTIVFDTPANNEETTVSDNSATDNVSEEPKTDFFDFNQEQSNTAETATPTEAATDVVENKNEVSSEENN